MIKADIDDHELTQAIAALSGADDKLAEAFVVAGQKTIEFITKDLSRGVGLASGDLASSITGDVVQPTWPEIEGQITGTSVHRGYDYAARLDKDGSMIWRSGKFKGRRSWGWFSYAGKRVARTATRRYFRQAVEKVVTELAMEMRGSGGA